MTPPRQSSGSPVGSLSASTRRCGASWLTFCRRPRSTIKRAPFLFCESAPPVCVSVYTVETRAAHFELHDGAVVVLRNQQIASLVGEDPVRVVAADLPHLRPLLPRGDHAGNPGHRVLGRRRRERRRCSGRCGTTSLRRAASRPARSAAARRRRRLARGDQRLVPGSCGACGLAPGGSAMPGACANANAATHTIGTDKRTFRFIYASESQITIARMPEMSAA